MEHFFGNAAKTARLRIIGLLQSVTAYMVLLWIFKGSKRFRIDRTGLGDIKPPFIVVGNHTSNIDPALVQAVIAPHACFFLATNYYFRLPVIGSILRLFGAIPKVQFIADVRSIKGAISVLAGGGIVGIFPEGRRSIDGSCCPIPWSLAKFIKKMKVPVVSIKTDGGYLVWPRWSHTWRLGPVETCAKKILSVHEINNMNQGQVYDVICRELDYNDYEWNQARKYAYKGVRLVENLHHILHQCPRCLIERGMKSEGNRLFCTSCGYSFTVDEYGILTLVEAPFEKTDPSKWFSWQKEQMKSRITAENFCIEAKVVELRVADKFIGGYRECGWGQLSLNKGGMEFYGTIDGFEKVLFFSIDSIPSISTEFKNDFEICDSQNSWWFFLAEEQQVVRIETAVSLLNELGPRDVRMIGA